MPSAQQQSFKFFLHIYCTIFFAVCDGVPSNVIAMAFLNFVRFPVQWRKIVFYSPSLMVIATITRPIAISRALRVFSDGLTDPQFDL